MEIKLFAAAGLEVHKCRVHGTFPSLGSRGQQWTHIGVDLVAPAGSPGYAFGADLCEAGLGFALKESVMVVTKIFRNDQED